MKELENRLKGLIELERITNLRQKLLEDTQQKLLMWARDPHPELEDERTENAQNTQENLVVWLDQRWEELQKTAQPVDLSKHARNRKFKQKVWVRPTSPLILCSD